ncbi:MAG: peroxiredoxin [Phycisphaerales bacterium]
MIDAGDTAPDFTLESTTGQPVTLSNQLGIGPVVLYFYPHDFTPVCTAQACMVRDRHADVLAAGYRIFGISAQGLGSHGKFIRRHALPFTLLADPDKRVARGYGVAGPLALFPRRATFVINQDGTVRERVVSDFRVAPHRDLLERLADLGPPVS